MTLSKDQDIPLVAISKFRVKLDLQILLHQNTIVSPLKRYIDQNQHFF